MGRGLPARIGHNQRVNQLTTGGHHIVSIIHLLHCVYSCVNLLKHRHLLTEYGEHNIITSITTITIIYVCIFSVLYTVTNYSTSTAIIVMNIINNDIRVIEIGSNADLQSQHGP